MSHRFSPRALALDLVLVVLFASVGRSSHNESLSAAGIAATAWPFLVGAVLGTALAIGVGLWSYSPRAGALIWVVTVAGAMSLRHLTDQGTARPFVIVATVTLGLLLVGWRVLMLAAARVAQRR